MVRGGGIAGLVITSTVDSATLSDEDAERLRALVDTAASAAHVDSPPATSTPDQPDASLFRITIEDNGKRSSVVLGERDLSPATRTLIEWVESAPSREESVNPPG